ncbi:hypothetical protein PspLS_10195 [Pyricularia sp. CBS 133598]|nr:hypothetical protein PspLS_10195 [Pyricularia sp. CBS 133598]
MTRATKWTARLFVGAIYLFVGAKCFSMGMNWYKGLVIDKPPPPHKLRNLGVDLAFSSSLLGTICAEPYPGGVTLVAALGITLKLLGVYDYESLIEALRMGTPEFELLTHVAMLGFFIVLVRSFLRTLPSSGAATAVFGRLLGFARVAALVLSAAVLSSVVCPGLPQRMWFGMAIYTCWVLALFYGMHRRSALYLGSCGVALGLTFISPALSDAFVVGIRSRCDQCAQQEAHQAAYCEAYREADDYLRMAGY